MQTTSQVIEVKTQSQSEVTQVAQPSGTIELSTLQLALVGGGSGNATWV
ncbi:MAG: hypothetical protein RL341_291 [Pseudomonadota bacterium]|jgi:hypothetical protein